MDCDECGTETGVPTRVEYTDGTTERLQLCPDCRHDFVEGTLVSDVTVVPSDS